MGVFGKPVKLTTGQTVTADEAYIREYYGVRLPSARPEKGHYETQRENRQPYQCELPE